MNARGHKTSCSSVLVLTLDITACLGRKKAKAEAKTRVIAPFDPLASALVRVHALEVRRTSSVP